MWQDRTPEDEFTVRDSAGVRIVMSRTPRSVDTWHLESGPSVVLGTSNDDPLVRVCGAVRLSDGRIVVGNARLSQLNYYQRDGSLLFRAGRLTPPVVTSSRCTPG